MEIPNTVYIVDDDPAARESVAALIRSRGLSTQTFASAEDFLRQYKPDQPGCVIADVRMTGMSGLDLQRRMAEQNLRLPVILITGYADVPTAVKAMQAGAVSFLEKPCGEDELWRNVSLALERDKSERELQRQRQAIEERFSQLSGDERQVFSRLVQGKMNKTIASELDIGLRTVELRRANILKKMSAESLADLVRMAIMAELVPTDLSTAG